MINARNLEEAKKLLKNSERPRIVLAQDDEFNRKIAEAAKFDILLSVEKGNRKNKIRQTDSGLNHVVAKICSKNSIAIGVDLDEIRSLEPKLKAERLAKIKQNIKLCRKSGVKIAVKTKKLGKMKDFLQGMGSSTEQIKEAIVF